MTEDYFRFFDEIAFADHPEWGCECYCCFFHAASEKEWEESTAAQRKALARDLIFAGRLQGLLAYAEDKPVAWCHYEQKNRLPGLKAFYPEWVGDDETTAAIVCFTVAQGFRKQGIAGKLLDTACQDLAAQGYSFVEAYPFTSSDSDEHNYHGPLSMYVSHGFAIYKECKESTVVRKAL